MGIIWNTGDLTAQEGIIVHGCNCQGVMGSGVARAIKVRFPAAFEAYRDRHRAHPLQLGETINVCHPITAPENTGDLCIVPSKSMPPGVIIVNAMTQRYYGREPGIQYVDYDALERAFEQVAELAERTSLPVHFPEIGCGLGGGQWSEVSQRINRAMGRVNTNLWLLPAQENSLTLPQCATRRFSFSRPR